MFGAGTGIGPAAILNVNDAIFAPLAREADGARPPGRPSGGAQRHPRRRDRRLLQRAAGPRGAGRGGRCDPPHRGPGRAAPGSWRPAVVPDLEVARAEAELARRQQAELLARERWQAASADLLRILRLDPGAEVEPVEPPHLRVEVVCLDKPVDDLIALALLNRPELASRQAQVQATLALLEQERFRPLVPSVLIRGWSTPVTGTLAVGQFGGGTNGSVGTTGGAGRRGRAAPLAARQPRLRQRRPRPPARGREPPGRGRAVPGPGPRGGRGGAGVHAGRAGRAPRGHSPRRA